MKKNNLSAMLNVNAEKRHVITLPPWESGREEGAGMATATVIIRCGVAAMFVKRLQNASAKFIAPTLLILLSACGGEPSVEIPAQKWQGAEISVESRPSPPQTGMNEFVVMATGEHHRPIGDLIVSLRTDDQDAWTQAIQDGQLGIYRRAAEVAPGSRSVLQVQIRHNGTESILRFPLNLAR